VLHPWLKEELGAIVAALPPVQAAHDAATTRALWQHEDDAYARSETTEKEQSAIRCHAS
jgi:hypothetical protein